MKKFINAFTKIDWENVQPGTIVRYVLSVVIALNFVLGLFNVTPINYDENKVYAVVSGILSVVVLFVNTYKNNSTSPEAILADEIMHQLKEKGLTEEPKESSILLTEEDFPNEESEEEVEEEDEE